MACPICGANCQCRKRGPGGLCCSCHKHKPRKIVRADFVIGMEMTEGQFRDSLQRHEQRNEEAVRKGQPLFE